MDVCPKAVPYASRPDYVKVRCYMRFVVEIECDNAAFEDDPSCEVANLLRKVVRAVEKDGSQEGRLADSNGNSCGFYKYEV